MNSVLRGAARQRHVKLACGALLAIGSIVIALGVAFGQVVPAGLVPQVVEARSYALQPEATAIANCTSGFDQAGNPIQLPEDCRVAVTPTSTETVTYTPLPPIRDMDCSDIIFAEDAQLFFDLDPLAASGLDLDQNGIACDRPPPLDAEALNRLLELTEPQQDVADSRVEAEGIVAAVIGEQPADPLVARQRGFASASSVWEMIAADDADRFCNAIGYSVPEGWDSVPTARPSPHAQARYWTCHTLVEANEVQCSQPISYTHPTDPTLSVPDGYWVVICRVYPLGGEHLGVVVDPRDFTIVDATGQRFDYRPFPIQARNNGGLPLHRERMGPEELTAGTLTFLGTWADLDPQLDFPLRLEWSPRQAIVPGALLSGNAVDQTVPVEVTLTAVIEEPLQPEIVDWNERADVVP
jgi:hypothetical protein